MKFIRSYFLIAISLLAVSVFAQIPERPTPPQAVNDFAGFLSQEEKSQLEEKLKSYYKQSSTAIVIVTVDELGDYDASGFSFELAEKWGIGKKSKNNGILVLASKQPRKVFIATGYGVEEFVTDAFSKRVVSTIIIPEFKKGDFYTGFDKGTTALIQKLEGKFTNEDVEEGTKKNSPFSIFIIIIIVIVFVLIKVSGRGGGRGGRGGGIMGGGVGFIPFGGFTNFGSGGSSHDSGSFGGFGGGSFGGGGAGGDW